MTTTSEHSGLNPTNAPPVPVPGPLTTFFWDAIGRGELQLLRCQDCGHYVHYPRPVCDKCQSENLAPEAISGRGTLYSYTWTHQAFHPFFVDKLPYNVAVVEIAEEPGVRLTTSVVDCAKEDVKTGMALEVTIREAAPGVPLPYFRPATEEN